MTSSPSAAAAGGSALPPAAVPELPRGELDRLRALFVQTPATLVGYVLGAGVLTWLFWALAPRAQMLGWLGAMVLLWSLRLAHYLRFLRQARADDRTLQRWRTSWQLLVLLNGALWGLAGWMFWGLGAPYQRLGLILVLYSYCVSAVQLLGPQPRVFVGFISVVFAPVIVRIASDGSEAGHVQLAVIATLVFLSTALMVRTHGSALALAISLKAQTEELADRLRVQMGLADEARRAAEAASRAKTQFFAAASHDLRQPLHAMGLFAEALRQRSHDPEVASLVNSINESVDALEGLFSELLDITRIDSGGVEVQPQSVRMKDLFARLRLHFEPIAFEKGLMLSFRGAQHVALADPVLLERILRNLVSNAIRYTDDGGVLLSCRLRGAGGTHRLLLQVWDSGIGIAEAALPHVFEEFYQVHSQRPLEPHQRKGLGLGLSIVQRLAALMDAPLTVRSRVGHGTVFSLLVPLGREPRPREPDVQAATKLPIGLTLQGRFIVVVEDEAAVRDGLVVLLQAWGADVVAFDSVEGVEAWLASAAARRPDLLLVDYRLPGGRTGIEALVALRARWPGSRLPAIVVTGSSLAGHEDEAQTHDYHLLIKPVLPNRLRAMIAFKLGVR